jgi:DNA-binding MarR family transcriptional regulator
MNKELMQTVSESLLKLRFLVVAHFLKPMREIERDRSEFPPGYMHVLGWLRSKGAPVSMTDLACASFVSKPNLTTMMDRLCSDGLVERSADVNDRRIVNVALTQKGVDFLLKHKAEVIEFIESRLSLLDDSELEKLKHAMDDIAEVLSIIGEKQK